MQSKNLKEFFKIIAGYTFREALKNTPEGKIQVVSAKNIHGDGSIDFNNLIRIKHTPPRTNSLVARNDVLLSSRGVFRAGVFSSNAEDIIAASSLFILRIKGNDITPEYLSIYLNSETGQRSIRKILTGSTIKTILRKALENLTIPVPPLEVQNKIVAINNNQRQRENLLIKKIYLNKNIAERAISQLLTT